MRLACLADMYGGVAQTTIKWPEIEHLPICRSDAPLSQDFSDVHSNLCYDGRGKFYATMPFCVRGAESLVKGDAEDLPQKYLADRL